MMAFAFVWAWMALVLPCTVLAASPRETSAWNKNHPFPHRRHEGATKVAAFTTATARGGSQALKQQPSSHQPATKRRRMAPAPVAATPPNYVMAQSNVAMDWTPTTTTPTPVPHAALQALRNLPQTLFQLWRHRVPQPLRFFLSGNCGNVAMFYMEVVLSQMLTASVAAMTPSSSSGDTTTGTSTSTLFRLLASSQDSISFLGAYLAHIVVQHWLHAVLVYGLDTINTPQKYWTTLHGMFRAMLTSAMGSTLLNTLLLKATFLPLSKTAKFVLTLWTFSAINYFWITWIVKRSEATSSNSNNNNSPPNYHQQQFQH